MLRYNFVNIIVSLNRALETREFANIFWFMLLFICTNFQHSGWWYHQMPERHLCSFCRFYLFNVWKRDLKCKWKWSTLLGEIKKDQDIIMYQYTSHRTLLPKGKTIVVSNEKSGKLNLSSFPSHVLTPGHI